MIDKVHKNSNILLTTEHGKGTLLQSLTSANNYEPVLKVLIPLSLFIGVFILYIVSHDKDWPDGSQLLAFAPTALLVLVFVGIQYMDLQNFESHMDEVQKNFLPDFKLINSCLDDTYQIDLVNFEYTVESNLETLSSSLNDI